MHIGFIIFNIKHQLTSYKNSLLLSLLLFLGCAFSAYALEQKPKANVVDYEFNHSVLKINTEEGSVWLTAYGEEAIEVVYHNQGKKNLPSFAIAPSTQKQKTSVINKAKSLTFSAGKLSAVITKVPFNISFYKNAEQLISQIPLYLLGDNKTNESVDKSEVKLKFTLSDEEVLLGGGERILGMNRRGHAMPLYNKAHYGYSTESNQMYFGLPAVMSNKKYILLFDNSAKGMMDIGKTQHNILEFNAVGGRNAYLVIAGDTYPKLIENYVHVTGKQPLPARWTLGSFASRFGYRSEQEVRNVVNKYQQEDFPLDALILDLYWFGKDIKGHMGNLDWDKNSFPTPIKMIEDLKHKGVKTIAITEPFILSSSKKWQSAVENNALAMDKNGHAKTFDFYFGNTGLVDVFNKSGREWFNQSYQRLHEQGIAGWWGDLGEPEVHPSDSIHRLDSGIHVTADEIHNVYGHRWAQMVYTQQLTMAPNTRPFVMMRSGFAGSQRYGIMPWTGDVSRTWGGLQSQVELSLQMSLFGLAYTHSDLGGFAGGDTFNTELYTRWLQYGVFQPVFRPHGQDHIASEPVFHDEKTKNILRKYVKLRYQLLPYNYTLAYQNSTTGMPLMRPLFFENEEDFKLINNTTSYLWGDAFLVTPVVEADTQSVNIALPKGTWTDYWNGTEYQGNQVINMPVSLKYIPVLVRGGSFIPMIDSIQSTQDYSSDAISLHYYADKSVNFSQAKMYEDDGESNQALEKGAFELLQFSAQRHGAKNEKLHFVLSKLKNDFDASPKIRNITLVIHNYKRKAKNITLVQGENKTLFKLKKSSLNSELNKEQQLHNKVARWNEEKQTLTMSFDWQQQDINVFVR
ncbi:TIM-barrel domain-containing protein [Colwellia sp. UCD-KL20]|uniref:glycoside hydrolase family 31 protein n=1 Tax=Colwellia sp. UCD-KL20 TaxID=1917165 RepID=UPI0009F9828A|nr:TIM-barrel domain-containing protein [Colwellia sp. UCD-KL20]